MFCMGNVCFDSLKAIIVQTPANQCNTRKSGNSGKRANTVNRKLYKHNTESDTPNQCSNSQNNVNKKFSMLYLWTCLLVVVKSVLERCFGVLLTVKRRACKPESLRSLDHSIDSNESNGRLTEPLNHTFSG